MCFLAPRHRTEDGFFVLTCRLGYVCSLIFRILWDRTRIDDDLEQNRGHLRGRSSAPYHQLVHVAQTTYENS